MSYFNLEQNTMICSPWVRVLYMFANVIGATGNTKQKIVSMSWHNYALKVKIILQIKIFLRIIKSQLLPRNVQVKSIIMILTLVLIMHIINLYNFYISHKVLSPGCIIISFFLCNLYRFLIQPIITFVKFYSSFQLIYFGWYLFAVVNLVEFPYVIKHGMFKLGT